MSLSALLGDLAGGRINGQSRDAESIFPKQILGRGVKEGLALRRAALTRGSCDICLSRSGHGWGLKLSSPPVTPSLALLALRQL